VGAPLLLVWYKSSFLKKRTKKSLLVGVRGGATRMPRDRGFCFFFQKEALS
jgi:hypothetical protein